MIGKSASSPVQRLLSKIIGAYTSADQSADSGDFVQNIQLSCDIAEQLRKVADEDISSAPGGLPQGLNEFLEAVSQSTAKGHIPEDRELLGLVDWAHRLYEECTLSRGSQAGDDRATMAAE